MTTHLSALLETSLRLADVLPDTLKMTRLLASSPADRAATANTPQFRKAMQALTGKKIPSYEDITKALEAKGFDSKTAGQYALFATDTFFSSLQKKDLFHYSVDRSLSHDDPEREYDESVQGSGNGRRLEEAKSHTTKMDITSKKGATVPKGTGVALSWKSSSGAEQPSLTRITDSAGNTVAVRTANLEKYVSGITKAPGMTTLEKWSDDGIAKSVLGAKVEPDGWDAQGSPSWMLALGLI